MVSYKDDLVLIFMLLIMYQGEDYQRPKEKRQTLLSLLRYKPKTPKATPTLVSAYSGDLHVHVLVNII